MLNIKLDGDTLRLLRTCLPECVEQMGELIGWHATAAMIERFGGSKFPIPRGVRRDATESINRLLEVLTPAQVEKIILCFGGEDNFAVPNCAEARRLYRNTLFLRDLNAALASGESHRRALTYLCPRYGIGNTTAWKLIRQRDTSPDAAQGGCPDERA